MKTLSEIETETNKEIEQLVAQAKKCSEILKTLNNSSKEYAEIFEKRSCLIEDAKAKFMSLRFAGWN